MFGSQSYPEGQFAPAPGAEHDWHVWCCTGALKVLQTREHEARLAERSGALFTINFGNGSAARIHPEHPLWIAMVEIAKTYAVQVFQLTLQGGYVPWDGSPSSLRAFDAIRISSK